MCNIKPNNNSTITIIRDLLRSKIFHLGSLRSLQEPGKVGIGIRKSGYREIKGLDWDHRARRARI